MNSSAKFTTVAGAIGNVQQQLEILQRDSKADAGKYSYKYTGMPTMWTALKPLLKKYGLTVLQSPVSSDGSSVLGDYMTTTIIHETSGEWVEYSMRLVITRDDPQGYGSAVTYAERYMIKSIFKVVTDDDNDATTQRMADGEQRKDWVRAYTIMAKKIDPDANPTYNDFMKFMTETYGKHPSKILAKEHQQVLDTINAFNPE